MLLYFLGVNPLGNSSWLAAWIPVVVICVSTKAYRENELEGFMTYGEAWNVGTFTGIAGAMLHALLIYIFLKVFNANLIESFKTENIDNLKKMESELKGLIGNSVFETTLEAINALMLKLFAPGFFNKTIGAILVSLITAAIFKRNKPEGLHRHND
ncbi:MAG: DUF4199 domain-containing protein [Bacteroidetes bacterium]|nr:DUF4199 domain-containing protein [Bacteroidota bacterium]